MVTDFKKAAGVIDVVPDVKAATVAITYDPKKTRPDALVDAFKESKYKVSKQDKK